MSVLKRFSEPVPKSGGTTANGLENLLGKPRLNPLTLLVRESMQNSWDARLDGVNQISFSVRGHSFDGPNAEKVREIFDTTDLEHLTDLRDLLGRDCLTALEIRDSNTFGLNGPFEAVYAAGGEARYQNFVLMSGVAKPTTSNNAGGSFGFGKGSYFRMSGVSTILIHTRPYKDGPSESRLIGMALGESFNDGKILYTGKHWFGDLRDEIAIPFFGEKADEVASRIGFGVPKGETGTSILILDPSVTASPSTEEDDELSRLDLRQIVEACRDQLLWQCWPKLTPVNGQPEVIADVHLGTERIPIPDLDDLPQFKTLRDTYLQALNGKGEAIEMLSPKLELGTLVKSNFPSCPGLPTDELLGFAPKDHHIALMRQAHLVVTYLEGPVSANHAFSWLGCFVASDADGVDAALRQSEPPSHDDWVTEHLIGPPRRIVNVTLSRLKEKLFNTSSSAPGAATQDQTPLSAMSETIGGLLNLTGESGSDEESGGGGGGGDGGGGGEGARHRKLPFSVDLDMYKGTPVYVACFNNLQESQQYKPSLIFVLDDGSPNKNLPDGVATPQLLGWSTSRELKELNKVDLPNVGEVVLVVELVPHYSISISLEVN